ncbi:hypothetical protein M885DRAFT_472941 [Pelagophyceae sp. CCMP2097]|nr:hypothetical protein M885DRAFT_472941 [Pelagophyceae sp. CCMP2097]
MAVLLRLAALLLVDGAAGLVIAPPRRRGGTAQTRPLKRWRTDASSYASSRADAPRAIALQSRRYDVPNDDELTQTLRRVEVDASTNTAVAALLPALAAAATALVAFAPCANWIHGLIGPEGLEVLANDQGQYFQNYINAVNILFSLLLVNTFVFLYTQQEQLYVSLFREVSVGKALLEQLAYVSRGRPEYADELLGHVEQYVANDLRALKVPAVVTLSRTNGVEPLEAVMWLTSVGAPGAVYDTVKALREARGARLGALQRKLPGVHFLLLGILGFLVLITFPLLGAATGVAVAPGDGLLQVQALLFSLLTFAVALTGAVLYAFWLPSGSAYNVDAVLDVMAQGRVPRGRHDERHAGGKTDGSDTVKCHSPPGPIPSNPDPRPRA